MINATPVFDDHACHIGAPKPFVFWITVNGVNRAFDSTLTARLKPVGGTAFDLVVGNGITLSTKDSVSNALVTIQVTVAQSRLIQQYSYATCEIQETVSGLETIVMMGRFLGIGGDNTGG